MKRAGGCNLRKSFLLDLKRKRGRWHSSPVMISPKCFLLSLPLISREIKRENQLPRRSARNKWSHMTLHDSNAQCSESVFYTYKGSLTHMRSTLSASAALLQLRTREQMHHPQRIKYVVAPAFVRTNVGGQVLLQADARRRVRWKVERRRFQPSAASAGERKQLKKEFLAGRWRPCVAGPTGFLHEMDGTDKERSYLDVIRQQD